VVDDDTTHEEVVERCLDLKVINKPSYSDSGCRQIVEDKTHCSGATSSRPCFGESAGDKASPQFSSFQKLEEPQTAQCQVAGPNVRRELDSEEESKRVCSTNIIEESFEPFRKLDFSEALGDNISFWKDNCNVTEGVARFDTTENCEVVPHSNIRFLSPLRPIDCRSTSCIPHHRDYSPLSIVNSIVRAPLLTLRALFYYSPADIFSCCVPTSALGD